MESTAFNYATQLAAAAPILLVYVAGIVLALVFWRRSPRACLLCLLGLGLLLLTTIVQPLVTLFIIHSVRSSGGSYDRIGLLLSVSGVVGSIVRAVGMGLVLGAVFTGRRSERPAGRGAILPPEEPLSARRAGTGITRPLGGESFSTGG